MCVVRHTQFTQNSKFAISLQYFKIEVSDEFDLHSSKHESLLQTDLLILIGIVNHFQSSQNNKFGTSLQYLQKKVRNDVDFLHEVDFLINIKFPFKLISTL